MATPSPIAWIRFPPASLIMQLTEDEVDQIEAVRQLVEDCIDYAEENPDSAFDESNLIILEAQLDALHQALSMAVAQKDGLQDDE